MTNHVLKLDPSPKTNTEYLQLVRAIYGTKKVQKVCSRYRLFRPSEKTKPLKIKDVKKLQQGLKDITNGDLDRIIKKLRCNKPLTIRENDALKVLGAKQTAELKDYATASELPVTLFNALVEALSEANTKHQVIQLDSSLSLSKISGLPGKYFKHGWISHQMGRTLEDEERLQICKEIQSLESEEQAGYCELLTKILVKKHLYYEQEASQKLKLGMLVPGLKGQDGQMSWYRVSEIMDTGWGKLAYRLVPATTQYPEDMPDLLLYRSSASLPTAMDSFTSYLNDINVLPPGYLSRHRSKKKELRWLTEATPAPEGKTRPLLITGHSLGASNGQIAMMNLFKSGQWIDREISLELFDSPAVSAKDAKEFAYWYNKQGIERLLTFNYYVSKDDPVPLAGSLSGSAYLGKYIENRQVTATVHQMKLTETGSKKKEISGIGPHGRIFFRGKKEVDFQEVPISIDEFDNKNKYRRIAINIVKVIGSIFVWGIMGTCGGLKRFFIGRRHHDPVIFKLFKKISGNTGK